MSNQLLNKNLQKINEISSWNNNNVKSKELLMHQIHVYPAKFPSFLVKKAIDYIENKKDAKIAKIGDIFCGCGTTGLEARLNKKEFWGCDINPVATLISKTKRAKYAIKTLEKYHAEILIEFQKSRIVPKEIIDHERINYWFNKESIIDLYNLLKSIEAAVQKGKYQDFFLVGFSNILKRTSMWLTKSIKPTIDKRKNPLKTEIAFKMQIKQMLKAVVQSSDKIDDSYPSKIENKNFLSISKKKPFLDLLITSPPYVTSYEYADLHQLSTLWLGFVSDYRDLRNGTIGSTYNIQVKNDEKEKLNLIGRNIYDELLKTKAAKKTSVLKYFLDMKITIEKSYSLIKKNGYAVFVIGNTKLQNVYIDNAKYLIQCMIDVGFSNPEIKKRKIDSKILTPFRDSNGKFSSDKRHRKVYNYEFILIAKK